MILKQLKFIFLTIFFIHTTFICVVALHSTYAMSKNDATTYSSAHYRLRIFLNVNHKRWLRSVSASDKSENASDDQPCHNGGRLEANNRCECVFPFTGIRCDDYACVHGISVGARYDPDSLFFNKPCICDEGWIGELCEMPTTNQCNSRGEFRDDRCHCRGYFFGSQCQYVSRCEHGKRRYGRCVCDEGWQGDYCHEIICQHGYPDARNGSQTCICPLRFSGVHCDHCAQNAPKIQPYPDCTIHISTPKARILRAKTDSQIRSGIIITISACAVLIALIIMMIILHQRRQTQVHKSCAPNRRRSAAAAAAAAVDLKECENILDISHTTTNSSEQMMSNHRRSSGIVERESMINSLHTVANHSF